MAHFRGTVQGNRGDASRLSGKEKGIRVEAQSWQGKVVVVLYHDEQHDTDRANVRLEPHSGAGRSTLLYDGPVAGLDDIKPAETQVQRRIIKQSVLDAQGRD